MKALKLLMILALPFIVACASSEKTPTTVVDENTIPARPSGELVRAYVESNDFIDVDYKAIQYSIVNPASSRAENVTEEDRAKMVAAVYRFYKHVSLVDSTYVWDINNGADINISEEIFSAFTNSLNEANAAIKGWNAKGERVDLQPITEEYLESLLK